MSFAKGVTVPAEDMDAAVRPILPLSLASVHGLPPAPFERLWRRWQLQSLLQQCLHLQQNTRAAAATIRDSPPNSPHNTGTRARVRRAHPTPSADVSLLLRFRSTHSRALLQYAQAEAAASTLASPAPEPEPERAGATSGLHWN